MTLFSVRQLRAAPLLAAVAMAGGAAPANAATFGKSSTPEPPALLPSELRTSASSASARTWIVGTSRSARATAVAQRFGAQRLNPGTWLVERGKARGFASALEDIDALRYSEPNRPLRRHQGDGNALRSENTRWRSVVTADAPAPPPVLSNSPLLALIDSQLDSRHPEFADSNVTTTGQLGVTDEHGTATAAVAAAPRNGIGALGVWPGMRATNFTLPPQITCKDSATNIRRAVRMGADVINMSYGSPQLCYAEYEQLQIATRAGVTLVAAAGNEAETGNPLEYPASLPHVVTVAAVNSDDTPSFFSNTNAAIDLSAPGTGILTAVPVLFDRHDGKADGFTVLDGTSFSAPMVAAAAAWVRQARPDLTPDQVTQVVRLGARDVGRRGWDSQTGFGVLSLEGALKRKAPPPDRGEPNDDVQWVDGQAFGQPNRRLWSGRGTVTRFGMNDRYEDYADVFRVRIPARSSAEITLEPRGWDPDLAVVPGNATRLGGAPLLARSRRTGRVTERVVVRNDRNRARNVYVVTYVHKGGKSLDAAYDLTIKRAP